MVDTKPANRKRLYLLHGTLINLNLGFALALAATLALERRSETIIESTGTHDWFRLLLLKINLFFYHSAVFAPFAADLVLTGLTVAFFSFLLMGAWLLKGTAAMDVIRGAFAGIAALLAVPISWLLFQPTPAVHWLAALYFAAVAGALYIGRGKKNPTWFVILGLHCIVFIWVLWLRWTPYSGIWPPHEFDLLSMWPMLMSLISPCAGIVWVLYEVDTLT